MTFTVKLLLTRYFFHPFTHSISGCCAFYYGETKNST